MLKPHAPKLIPALLESLSVLEPQVLNYLSLCATDQEKVSAIIMGKYQQNRDNKDLSFIQLNRKIADLVERCSKMQREIANTLLKEVWSLEYGWTNVEVFLKGWDFFYSLDHQIFQKVENTLSKNCC